MVAENPSVRKSATAKPEQAKTRWRKVQAPARGGLVGMLAL
jgi:hypothetical protein